ncbi:hypothetical protein GLOIN_2v1773465 [Rhizophagus irregularis DAOM 181602=DAOM 197198]|nr:hypothetical protein GLOIN_2v1773465 [Rhizophagus irregularis DAOM 181602=DAOM 197198]
MATLWADRKPQSFLTTCGASVFKIIQTSKAPTKQKAKNVPDKKPRKPTQQSGNVNLKKKDQKSSTSAKKQAKSTKDPLKDPKSQKSKSNKKSRDKGGNKDNMVVLAEILSLLRKLV